VVRAGFLRSLVGCCLAVVSLSLSGCGGDDENAVPVALAQSVDVDEDAVLHGQLLASDRDSSSFVYSLSGSAPAQGSLQVEPNGSYTFTPAENFNGEQSFMFVATDGKATSAPAPVRIVVKPRNDAPRIASVTVSDTTDEDTAIEGQIAATDVEGSALVYAAAGPVANGVLEFSAPGAFKFTPAADFNGETSFALVASDGEVNSTPAEVRVTVRAVNDPPSIRAIADLHNRADVYALKVAIDPQDVDGDVTTFEAVGLDPQIARMEFDAASGILTLYPLAEGVAHFDVAAADGQYRDSASFALTVGEVTHELTVERDTAQGQAVAFENVLDLPVRFRLDVNGALAPGAAQDIVAAIRAAPDLAPGESMPLKIWHRMVDVTFRSYPISESQWLHDPVIYLNSLGAGFCDDMASAYYQLAVAAGYEGRVWTLGGHVVPELRIDGVWHMYDPDLGAYYVTQDGDIAGVELLAATPTLITSPIVDTLLPSRRDVARPYDPEVAQLYATVQNNLAWDFYTAMPTVQRTMEINLPPGGAIAFPGPWDDAPLDIQGAPIPSYANLMVSLPQGWLGTQRLPLVLSAIRGSGRVTIGNQQFDVGSAALAARLANHTAFIDEVTVVRSDTVLQFVYLLNPATVSATGHYDVKLQGTFVAGLQLQ
jgi:hypothetical protein